MALCGLRASSSVKLRAENSYSSSGHLAAGGAAVYTQYTARALERSFVSPVFISLRICACFCHSR
jgi:hypothetical protein